MSRRLVCAIRFRAGAAEALSSTGDLPAVEALLAAAGDVERRRASDVSEADGGHVAVVRAWVSGAPVRLPDRSTREAAIADEVAHLAAALRLPAPR